MTARLYHNVVQNRAARFSDDVADAIVADGFTADGFDGAVWLSTRPLGDGLGQFTGVAVTVPAEFDIRPWRRGTDALEDLDDVEIYAIPASDVNAWSRERWYPRPEELVEG